MRSRGVPESRIMMSSYQAPSVDVSAPVRVSYTAMRAQTNKCGRWPDDLMNNSENKHYANFGCSYQNNLAAQIANPADLLGPRKQSRGRRGESRQWSSTTTARLPVPANSEVDVD